jgi:hypothetical protein
MRCIAAGAFYFDAIGRTKIAQNGPRAERDQSSTTSGHLTSCQDFARDRHALQ